MADLTKISSEYDMLETLINVGKTYFGDDLSTNRIGMFGTITESMANVFGATILDSDIRAKEANVVTANKMSTLLQEASILDLDVSTAIPSYMTVYLGVNVDYIHSAENSDASTGVSFGHDTKTYHYIIEKESNINIGGYNFMLERDICITAQYSNVSDEYAYSARYLEYPDVDPHNNEYVTCKGYEYVEEDTLSSLENKYLNTFVLDSGNKRFVLVRATIRQMSKDTSYDTIVKNDLINLSGMEYVYNDQICNFNAFIRDNSSSPWTHIKSVSEYDTSSYSDNVIHYEIDYDKNKLILNIKNFTPKYNSELRVDIYTTTGSSGNITYTGNGDDIVMTLQSFEDRHTYSGQNILVLPITSAISGSDIPTKDILRNRIIRRRASLDSIDTDYDLYNFMRDRDETNDFLFSDKRCDIEHIWSFFMMPRTTSGDIIPTATKNLLIKKPTEDTYENNNIIYRKSDNYERITISAGACAVEQSDEDRINSDNNYATSALTLFNRNYITPDGKSGYYTNTELADMESVETKLYGLPYTVVYNYKSQLATYYLTSVNEKVYLGYRTFTPQNDNTGTNFAIDHMTITRNTSTGDKAYTVNVQLMPSGDISATQTETTYNDPSTATKDTIMVMMVLYKVSQDTNDEEIYGFVPMSQTSYENGIFGFTGEINVLDDLSYDNKSTSKKSIYRINDDDTSVHGVSGDVFDNCKPSEVSTVDVIGLKVGFAVYYLYRDDEYIISDENGDNHACEFESNGKPVLELTSDNEIALHELTKYPYIKNTCTYVDTDGNKYSKELEYTLTDIYANDSNPVDLFVYMGEVMMCVAEELSDGDDEYLLLYEVPMMQYSKLIDKELYTRVTDIISDTKGYLDELNTHIHNNFSIDYKFYNTYGPSKYFNLQKIDNQDSMTMGNLDLTIAFNLILKPGVTTTHDIIVTKIKEYLKDTIEALNTDEDDYTQYISNIITGLETNFTDFIQSIELASINGNSDMNYRILKYNKPTVESLESVSTTREALRDYVPEYINLPIDNITINIVR